MCREVDSGLQPHCSDKPRVKILKDLLQSEVQVKSTL